MVRNEKNITYTCKQVNTCALKFICIYIILIACFVHNTVDKFSKVCSTKMIILLPYFLHMNELRHHWNIHVLHKGQVMPWYRDNRKLNRNQIYVYLSMICIWLHDEWLDVWSNLPFSDDNFSMIPCLATKYNQVVC